MTVKDFKLGIIGVGNMAEAILRGVLSSGLLRSADITGYELKEDRVRLIKKNYNICFQLSLAGLVIKSRFILIAVKPQEIIKVLEEVKTYISPDSNTIISIAAGVSTSMIEKMIGKDIPVLRIMPNTPALLNRGMSAISKGRYASSKDLGFTVKIIKSIGNYVIIDEKFQNAVTSISGSGPAYFFLFSKFLVDAAVRKGIDRNIAGILVSNTAAGAGEMIINFNADMDNLIKMVASPGGTTEAALKKFESLNLEQLVYSAVDAAEKRAIAIQNSLEAF